MKTAEHEDETETREADEAALRVIRLAGEGWGLADIATDAERDVEWVIETLHAHRDIFRAEYPN